jgi:histidinol-phosphatase (PHP family)
MVDAAKKTKVSRLSTTEHISQFTFMRQQVKFASVHESGRMFSSFDDYLKEFDKIRDLDGIRVRRGLEVDYIGKYSSEIGQAVSTKKWDVLLCSVHELPGGIDVEEMKLPMDKKSVDKRWREYIELQIEAIESNSIPFDILTHPERLAVGTPSVPDDLEELMYELAKVARKNGKAVEINGADLTRTPDLVRKLASACHRANCKVSYGSDSHYPDQVSRNFDQASKLIEEFSLEVV